MPARMPRRLLMLLCLAALALGLTACGTKDEEQGVDEPAREGLALELGGVDYNVFITRQLNIEDPAGQRLLRRPRGREGRDALRRVHPGLQPLG